MAEIMGVVDWVEKAHGLITLAIAVKEGVDSNKSAFDALKAKLGRIDRLIKSNEKLFNETRPKCFINLIDACQNGLDTMNKYSAQGQLKQIINFDSNSEDFKSVDVSLDNALTDLRLHIQSRSQRIIPPEFKEYVLTAEECITRFSQDENNQLFIWVDRDPNVNLPNIRQFNTKNPKLLFIQCTCWEEVQQIIEDKRISVVARSVVGFFRVKIIAHPMHSKTMNGPANPNAVAEMLEELYSTYFHISVLVYAFNKDTINAAIEVVSKSDYPYCGVTREQRDLDLFCQGAMVLFIGDFSNIQSELATIQNRGVNVVKFDPYFFEDFAFDLPWAEAFVDQAIKFSTPPTSKFSVILSSNATEQDKILFSKINLVKRLKQSEVWEKIRILCFCPQPPRRAITELCDLLEYESTSSVSEIYPWLKRSHTPIEIPTKFKVHIRSITCNNLKAADRSGLSDPFCVIKHNNSDIHRTEKRLSNLNPSWPDLKVEFVVTPGTDDLKLVFYDWNLIGRAEYLGGYSVAFISDIASKYREERLITIRDDIVDVMGTGASGLRGSVTVVFWWTSHGFEA